MIIQRLDLKAFGIFTDRSLDLSAGPKRFHLVYGPNESGKSTSLRAITSLLFGIPHVTEDNFLHANPQLRVGGLLVDESGNQLELVRRRGRKATLRDGADQDPIDENLLHKMLGGVDRETFLTRFGLSHDELTSGGQAILKGDGDLGEILFAAGAGVGRLREIQDQLDEEGGKLFTPRGNRTINAGIKQLDERRKELRQAQIPPADYASLGKQIDQKQNLIDELQQSMQQIALELARLKACRQAMPLVAPWRNDIRTLAELNGTPLLDDAFTERRRHLESDRQHLQSQIEELDATLTDLTAKLEGQPEDAPIMTHAGEVQTLFQELAARDKADRDRVDLLRVQKNADRKITELLRELSVELLTDDESEKSDFIDDSVQRLRVSDSLRTRVHELAAQHERLIQQRDDARDHVEAIRKRLREIQSELREVAEPVDPASLSGVIDSVGAPAAILESLAQQQDFSEQLERECEARAQSLGGFDGDFRNAARLRLPTQTEIDRHTDEIRRSEEGLASTRERLHSARQQSQAALQELERQQADTPLPSEEQLREARLKRDQSIDRWAADPGVGEQEVRQAVRLADELADSLRTHHLEVHRRAEKAAEARTLQQQVAELESASQKAAAAVQQSQDNWFQLWDACGVVADTPERMKPWMADQQQLTHVVSRLEEETKRLDQLQRNVHRSTSRLRAAVGTVATSKAVTVDNSYTQVGLFDDEPVQDLVSLYDEAVSLRAELTRRREQHDALTRRRDELAEEFPLAEARLETQSNHVEKWRKDWTRVTDSFAESESATPTVVMSMLRRIDELCEKKRERDILCGRIRSIGDDELAFGNRVRRVADAVLFEDPKQNEPGAITHILYQRLQTERSASRQREVWSEQIEEMRRKRQDLERSKTSCEESLRQLCAEAKCESAADLPNIEQRSRECVQVQSSLRDLENQLTLLADDQPIDAFVDSLADKKPAVLDIEIEQQERELDDARQALTNANQEVGALRHELRSMNGDGRAAEISQSIQLIAGAIGRDAEDYARLRIASLLLRRAIDHYRQENQSPVLSIAEDIFRTLTCGEYDKLKVDFDAKGKSVLFGVKTEGVDVPAPAMSTGTADALYLALRLASLQHQLHHGEPIPLVIDDCLIQLDDRRCVAALQTLSDLSLHTQVILFTHHQHLHDLAKANLKSGDFHWHQLKEPVG